MTIAYPVTEGGFKWYHLQIRRLCMPLVVHMTIMTAPMTSSNSIVLVTLTHADGQSQRQPLDLDGEILWQFPSQSPWLINSVKTVCPIILIFHCVKVCFNNRLISRAAGTTFSVML